MKTAAIRIHALAEIDRRYEGQSLGATTSAYKGTAYYQDRYREQQIRSLTKRAQKLGLQVVIPQTA